MIGQNDTLVADYYIFRVCYHQNPDYIQEVECISKTDFDSMSSNREFERIIMNIFNQSNPIVNNKINHFQREEVISYINNNQATFRTMLINFSYSPVSYEKGARIGLCRMNKYITTKPDESIKDNLGELPKYKCS